MKKLYIMALVPLMGLASISKADLPTPNCGRVVIDQTNNTKYVYDQGPHSNDAKTAIKPNKVHVVNKGANELVVVQTFLNKKVKPNGNVSVDSAKEVHFRGKTNAGKEFDFKVRLSIDPQGNAYYHASHCDMFGAGTWYGDEEALLRKANETYSSPNISLTKLKNKIDNEHRSEKEYVYYVFDGDNMYGYADDGQYRIHVITKK